MMENGSILEIGTYNQLLDKNEKFIEFVKNFEALTKEDSGILVFFLLISYVKSFHLFI
jgi:hypothetical protein